MEWNVFLECLQREYVYQDSIAKEFHEWKFDLDEQEIFTNYNGNIKTLLVLREKFKNICPGV